jgi:hypothetical protein
LTWTGTFNVSNDTGVGGRNSVGGSAPSDGGTRPATKPPIWTRSFIIISLVNLLNAIVFLLLVIVMSTIEIGRAHV